MTASLPPRPWPAGPVYSQYAKPGEPQPTWPPQLWQRVELRYTDVRGTVIRATGITWFIVLDNTTMLVELREHNLAPVPDELAPGWVPYLVWKEYMAEQRERSANFDLLLTNGQMAFEAYPKPYLTGDFEFQCVGRPYHHYHHTTIAKIRPSGF